MPKDCNCFNGLSTVNIELTSRCNKNCWMCGRRKIDKNFPEITMNYGDMDFSLLKSLAEQIPDDIVVQFHSNGEPLLYPELERALLLFKNNIRCYDTNAKLLVERTNDIIDNLEILTISVIENDPEGDEQYNLVKKFLKIKGNRKPNLVYRLLGNVENKIRWTELPGIVASRVLHHPLGSYKYKKNPTKPEIGICLDLLHHLCIDRLGKVYPCVRLDPLSENVIGDLNSKPLIDIWNSDTRKDMIKKHIRNKRSELKFCSKCEYWGVPTGNLNQ